MSSSDTTIFVCVTCRDAGDAEVKPGAAFLDALREKLAALGETAIKAEAVECLAVCKRPSTVALAGEGKWNYVIGDLEGAGHVDEIIESARAFAAAENGVVPWKDRPASFKKGVISRTPPLPPRGA